MPLVVIVGLALGNANDHTAPSGSTGSGQAALAPVSVSAPPPDAAAATPCTKLLAQLPVTLNGLPSRPALSTSTFVVAWGNPAVVLRCGVPRPAALVPGSGDLTLGIDGVYYLKSSARKAVVFTSIDRAAYVEVTVPTGYAAGPIPPVSDAIAKAMPAVCVVDDTAPVATQCTHRP